MVLNIFSCAYVPLTHFLWWSVFSHFLAHFCIELLSYFWVFRVLYIQNTNPLSKMWPTNIFSQSCQSLNIVFQRGQVLNFDEIKFISIFLLYIVLFGVRAKKFFAYLSDTKISSWVFSRHFIVLEMCYLVSKYLGIFQLSFSCWCIVPLLPENIVWIESFKIYWNL